MWSQEILNIVQSCKEDEISPWPVPGTSWCKDKTESSLSLLWGWGEPWLFFRGNTDTLSLCAEIKWLWRWFYPSSQAMIQWAAIDQKSIYDLWSVHLHSSTESNPPMSTKPSFAQQSLAVSWLEQHADQAGGALGWAGGSHTAHQALTPGAMPLSLLTSQVLNRVSSGLVWTLSPICIEMNKALLRVLGWGDTNVHKHPPKMKKSNVRPSLQERFCYGCSSPHWRTPSSSPHKHKKETRLSVATLRFSVFHFGYGFRSSS